MKRSLCLIVIALLGCSSLPEPKVKKYAFPENAYIGEGPKRPHRNMGLVRSKVDYSSLNAQWEEDKLCKNYFNKAVQNLVRDARKEGADAVIDVRSVVFMVDGKVETFSTPECSDDGEEGQILTQGIAVKWLEEIAPGQAVETDKKEAGKKDDSSRARQQSVGKGFVPADPAKKELGQ